MYTNQAEESITAERERLILEHLPQVRLIARRIHSRLPENVSLDDLISTGVVGLISAVDHFDPSLNTQLKPKKKRQRAKQIEVTIAALEQRIGRAPAEEEIAAELKITLEEYQQWLYEVSGLTIGSLEPASENHDGDLLNYIPDSQDDLPSAAFERAELERLLASAIEQMPKMERTVLSLYYQEEATLREIAEITHMHLSRVAQLKSQAVLRLRTYMERRWSTQR
jgi:RNA polymerase sigma factor for flagellar operon FliA